MMVGQVFMGMTTNQKSSIRTAAVVAALLSVPFIARLITDQVNWTARDFI